MGEKEEKTVAEISRLLSLPNPSSGEEEEAGEGDKKEEEAREGEAEEGGDNS